MTTSLNTKKDGSISDQESATAFKTKNPEKDSVINQHIGYNDHVPTPPAGFSIGYEDDLNGEVFMYCTGPKATSGQITVETFWSIPGGIEYHVTNDRHADNGIFNEAELIELSRLIREVMATTKVGTAPNAGIKLCARCNEGKPLNEFSKQINARDGLQGHCKACAREYYAKGGETND